MIVFRKNVKVSIVIPVLNSHTIVRRQLLYFHSLHLPPDVEIILMDDGSDPPLKSLPLSNRVTNLNIYPTGDTRPWTQTAAKNLGVKIAEGEFVFITDIDHILTPAAIEAVRKFTGDKMQFPREWGIIDRNGRISQDKATLMAYGMREVDYARRGLYVYMHTNTFAMRRSIFIDMGGYPPHLADQQRHHIYDDNILYGMYRRYVKGGKAQPAVMGPPILTFPHAKQGNPKLYFHDLDRSR